MKTFAQYIKEQQINEVENASIRAPHLYFKGFNKIGTIQKPSIVKPIWTGSYEETYRYVDNKKEAGIAIFFIQDTSRIKLLDIRNKNDTMIFGNLFSESLYDINLGFNSIFLFVHHLLKKFITSVNVNEIIYQIESSKNIILDDMSKIIINEIIDVMKKTNEHKDSFIDKYIFPIFSKIAYDNGYNVIVEYEYDDDMPSYVFISDEFFPTNKKFIYVLRNGDMQSPTIYDSPANDILASIDIYGDLNYFNDLVKNIRKFKQTNKRTNI